MPMRDSGVPTLTPGGPPVAETTKVLAKSSIVRTVKNEPWDRVSACSVRDETYEVLRTHAAKAEQDDRPAMESLDALRKDGVFALRTPRDRGGAWAGAEAIAGAWPALPDLVRLRPGSPGQT
jgi:alkylation response protein AidB-like acyl-CoA dehydrogenase